MGTTLKKNGTPIFYTSVANANVEQVLGEKKQTPVLQRYSRHKILKIISYILHDS